MKTEEIIKIIEDSNIPTEEKSKLLKIVKKDKAKDKILTVLRFLDISADIISLFIDSR
jgi:hypothetical protein